METDKQTLRSRQLEALPSLCANSVSTGHQSLSFSCSSNNIVLQSISLLNANKHTVCFNFTSFLSVRIFQELLEKDMISSNTEF